MCAIFPFLFSFLGGNKVRLFFLLSCMVSHSMFIKLSCSFEMLASSHFAFIKKTKQEIVGKTKGHFYQPDFRLSLA